jgi:glycosyltransferase involved in cell wall biosynthesis
VSETLELSIVLPCYNEAENLPALLRRYADVWESAPAELILVDNGSTDDTPAVLVRELADPALSFARVVRVPKNRGYGHGIYTGLQSARGEFVGFSHADQQCDAADVFAAYHKLRATADPTHVVIKGKRARRDLGAMVITHGMSVVASAVLGSRLSDINAQPKVFHRSHLDRLTQPPDGFPFDLYVLYQARQAGLRIDTVPVVFGKRGHGQSKWAFSLLSRWRTIWNMVKYIFHLRLQEGRRSARPAAAALPSTAGPA